MKIIREINDLKEGKEDNIKNLEFEIKNIQELYEKKKSILIPKTITKSEGPGISESKEYKPTEFTRPETYIIYGETKRIDCRCRFKDYEIFKIDENYLSKSDITLKSHEYEQIIISLEKDVDKGEMIPFERAKHVINSSFPFISEFHCDLIYKYWISRREILQKSLMRRYWRDQKYTDKYLQNTFKKRDRERMKTRKNKNQQEDAIKKLKEMQDQSIILHKIISSLKLREECKKVKLKLEQIEFEHKICSTKSEKIDNERKYNSILSSYIKPKELEIEKEQKIEKNVNGFHQIRKEKLRRDRIKTIKRESKDINLKLEEISDKKKEEKSNTIKKEKKEKSEIKKEVIDKELYKYFHYRIRNDRLGRIVIDRYFNKKDSFDPFENNFNEIMMKQNINPNFNQNCKFFT